MKPVSRSYQFTCDYPVDKLWEVISDTPRWAEASGMPKYQASEQLQDDGTVKVTGRVEIAGLKLSWDEPPANWVFERWFEQTRIFHNGPMVSMSTRAEVADCDGGSRLDFLITFKPRNVVGHLLSRRLVHAFRPKVQQVLDSAARLIRANQPNLFVSDFQLVEVAQERAESAIKSIEQTPYGHGLAKRLVEYIEQNQDVDLATMRPLALARRWQTDERLVVELFLQSVRSGLLESRWDVLCPRCRLSKAQTTNMGDVPNGVHCAACNIDYEADFANNVELSFSPSPSIRKIESGYFCRSGPGATPHIKEQYSLAPGESEHFPLTLAPGEYRLRTLEAGDALDITLDSESLPAIVVSQNAITLDESGATAELALHNQGVSQRTIVVEERSWLRDVLTAERVTTLQAFRDLFSDQVLRPGDDIQIRNITFVFTDLVDSTALFEAIGDAAAYRLVRAHFSVLGSIVQEHNGTIVKTVGDGIHAAFLTPDEAVQASIEMQRAMLQFNVEMGTRDIAIRIGINSGSSISVTLNGRLDYYGSMVNLAARLQGVGKAGEITLSESLATDPAVSQLLETHSPKKTTTLLKGVSGKATLYQFSPGMSEAA